MNVLRNPLRQALRRPYSTVHRPFVPPAQLNNVQPRGNGSRAGGGGGKRRRRGPREDNDEPTHWETPSTKVMPDSPSFYTGRPVYYDQVILLQNAIAQSRMALKTLQLLPLPEFARQSLPPLRPVWKGQDEMTTDFQSKMTTSRYRRVITLLNELNGYLNIASAANCTDLEAAIGQIVAMFESGKKAASVAQGKRKKVELDTYGRSYTVGKRKTSSARVWMIPVHANPTRMNAGTPGESIEEIFGLQEPTRMGITTSTVLVNNIPLAEYFPIPADRERIMRPLKVAGVVGAYNIFAIVRGGGTTGQSGALAHGIAKGLVAHEPLLETVLKRAKLTRRDPRMVERKKTGLAKARKRYTWVKR
ncbi:putative universal ribosomal protein uS9 family protein [Lyophyllum shimeji]|uniref:Universal ribosomal protein uS9 family protein n=1 Tax=Lyophyllum shimeji TaxID=47721 RepID=A0A9P3ULR0_LYOSH|nr:putative universal ribosomal protein uS9 family protein [Lyophyllum shimeji]